MARKIITDKNGNQVLRLLNGNKEYQIGIENDNISLNTESADIIDVDVVGTLDVAGNSTLAGATNYIGASAKTGYNRLAGYTKIDYRPTGGGTNSYALQGRMEIGATSGAFIGFDNETHLKATGTATVRGTQGVAVVDTGYTATGTTLIGTYGQARADGTVAGSSFMTGLYGLIEASAAITATHVTSCWLDSHQANAVTGQHDLLYMTNNGAAVMDQAIFLYGGGSAEGTNTKITNLIELNRCGEMVGSANGIGSDVYINITIDGVAARIAAKYVA